MALVLMAIGTARKSRRRALLTAALLGACAALGSGGAARAQFFSPGPLARPHASLEGLGRCGSCHDEQRHIPPDRCLSCHTELAPEVKQHTGLHGRMAAEIRSRCASCHPDHRGRSFAMVSFTPGDRRNFDHARTGWPLLAKHAATACEGCHDNRRLVLPSIIDWLAADPRRPTFLGLQARCDNCHFDEHRGQLGRECQRCHTDSAWTFMSAPTFDHGASTFPLRGKHKPVPCGDCHPQVPDRNSPLEIFPKPRAASFTLMKPIAHATCETCHRDPHQGSLGPSCADCHTEAGWNVIRPMQRLGTSFHDKTRFPLLGRHADVSCKACHGPFRSRPAQYRGLAFKRCGDCHLDGHEGQLAARPGLSPSDCGDCHTVNGFAPPHFELEQHDKTPFPLAGAHQATACRGCHPVDAGLAARVPAAMRAKLAREHRPQQISLAVLRPKTAAEACSACHRDPHEGQFSRQIANNDCHGCHTTDSFSTSSFNHDEESRFPLTGAHRTAPCAGCHKREPIRAGGPMAIRYTPLSMACRSCHTDVHQGQFAARGSPNGGRRDAKDCSFCHSTASFDKSVFTHDDRRFTTFALAGKHAALSCDACHRPVQLSADVRTIRYRPLPRTCEGCHVDFHRGDFKGFEP